MIVVQSSIVIADLFISIFYRHYSKVNLIYLFSLYAILLQTMGQQHVSVRNLHSSELMKAIIN